MKKYKTLFSYSLRHYGDEISVYNNLTEKPLFIGGPFFADMGDGCRALAAELLKTAYLYDHAKDFCAPEYDQEEKEKQLEKLRDLMLNNF